MDYRKYYKGEFWPKDQKEKKLFGLLKFVDGVAYIDLYGSFISESKKSVEIGFVYGLLENNQFCIFHNCTHPRQNLFRSSNFLNFDFFIHAPKHLFKPSKGDNLEFTTVKFRFDFLSDWTGINVYEVFIDDEGNSGINIIHPDLKDFILFNDKDFLLRIAHQYSYPLSNSFSKYELSQESWLIAEINGELDFNGVFSFLENIEEIFTLLNGKEIQLTTPFVLFTKLGSEFICFKNRIKARFEPIVLSESNRIIHVPIFNLNQIQDLVLVRAFFESWPTVRFKYKDSIKSIVNCFKHRNLNPESTFLNLAFALEKIIEVDKGKIGDINEMSPDEQKHLSILVEKSVPQNTLNFISARLKKKSGKRLKEKVAQYFLQLNCPLDQLIGKDQELFVNKLVDSRNHLAHLCDSCKDQMRGEEYPIFNKKLLKVLYLIIFLKMGLPKEGIIKNLRTNPNIALEF
ncbi:HEPN domain-containing protein [Algoriphagus yeomjeoni]|uniref:ApeA N-terminal domain 1-containing protein n=1 Tax=Algoriphagus yeomjeoni TaxID=291403 RepID=UPI003CE4E160